MAKQLTAPGCIYSIVARVDTTIYSPDQNWVLDVPAGQTDFIAETNEIIIPADAMMRRKTRQHAKDRNRINLLGRGSGSLATFVARAIERIVGKGNAKVVYGDGKLTVALTASATAAQFSLAENLLDRMLPKDVVGEVSDTPIGYTRVEFLESDGGQYILAPWKAYDEIEYISQLRNTTYQIHCSAGCSDRASIGIYLTEYNPAGLYCRYGVNFYYSTSDNFRSYEVHEVKIKDFNVYLNKNLFAQVERRDFEFGNSDYIGVFARFTKLRNAAEYVYHGAIYRVSIKSKDSNVYNFIPCLDPAGVPCMFDTVTQQPFRNNGTGQFIVGLTMKQAIDLANLPAPTTINTLTVSLPKEASLVYYNQEVEAALEAAAEKGWNIAVQYRDEFENELLKYAACKTVAEVKAVNPDYLNDLTSDGEWVYPLDSLTNANALFDGDKSIKRFGIRVLPNATSTNNMFRNSSIEELTLSLPKVIDFSSYYMHNAQGFCTSASELKRAEITIPLAKHQNEAFSTCGALETLIIKETKNGIINRICFRCYALFYFRTDATEITQAEDAFANCKLDKESALHILQKLATYTDGAEHLITLGIHIDHQNDEEVWTAIHDAEEKGWTLTVQWNPGGPTYTTPEASTFNMGTLIYAKVGEIELPDGTTEKYLDWGHYVTNWEERGYEQFRSLESAYRYFGLEQETNE